MARLALVFVVMACGGGAKQRPGTWQRPPVKKAERTIDQWTAADEDKYIGLSCQNMVGPDGAFRCPVLEKAGLQASSCVASMGEFRNSTKTPKERHAFRMIVAGLSLAESCDEVAATFRLATSDLVESTPDCPRRKDGSFDLSGEQMLQRRGLGDRTFTDTPSTATTPIQVCGLEGELRYLTRLVCADGSKPWGNDMQKAHKARNGSTMAKSPWCAKDEVGMPVDIYEVPCPEKKYEVFIDMYSCGPGEQLRR